MINATVLELYKVTASLLERYNLEARWGWKWRWSGSSLRRKRGRHCQQMPPHHVTSVMHLCLSIYSLSDQLCLRSHPWEGGMNLLTLSLNLWDLMKVQSYTTCDDPAWRKVLTCCCQYSLNPHPIVAVCSRWVLLLFPLSQTESCILTFYKVPFFSLNFFIFFIWPSASTLGPRSVSTQFRSILLLILILPPLYAVADPHHHRMWV